MSAPVYLLTIALFLATVLLVFGMKYFSAAFQARARLASDAAYRSLAEQAVASQTENHKSLMALRAEVSQVASSLAAIEKILKQVE